MPPAAARKSGSCPRTKKLSWPGKQNNSWKVAVKHMFVAKVTGSVVATQKVASMVGHKLLVVEPYRIDAKDRRRLSTTGRTFVAVDTVGAGLNEFVLIV